jgi:hypothetical protein
MKKIKNLAEASGKEVVDFKKATIGRAIEEREERGVREEGIRV